MPNYDLIELLKVVISIITLVEVVRNNHKKD